MVSMPVDIADPMRPLMNWDIIQRELAKASAFELHQIRSLLRRPCEDPARIARIRGQFHTVS